MAERRRQNANRIRGPQSALTDFLASHNISAVQIQEEHQRRLREAEQQEAEGVSEAAGADDDDKENESVQSDEAPEERKKRKRREERAIQKIKQSKEFAKKKKRNEDNEDFEEDDELARSLMYKKQKKLPGQLANCEECGKRFTVTAYSKTGPDGGLLCTKCSKEFIAEEAKNKIKKRSAPRNRRRQMESNRLDGLVQMGSRSLLEHCVVKVAENINDVEELGDLPQNLLDRLSQILSKRRVLTSHTLDLLLKPDLDKIAIYDSGKLETDDFQKILAFMPGLVDLNLRFAGQIKDPVIDYMLEHNPKIKHLQLGATNLVSDKAWRKLFQQQGPALESLKLSDLNDSLDDQSIAEMVQHCANLTRLKLEKCNHMTEGSLEHLTQLQKLEHLTLNAAHESSAESMVNLIQSLGPNLRTLSLEHMHEADDSVLSAMHNSCARLTKFRFTDNVSFSDAGFASLFTNWANPPLKFIDLSENRDIDNQNPNGPDPPVGLASSGFQALMSHSGGTIERLNISSCRHITFDALSKVFDEKKEYPCLKELDVSFLNSVDDFIVGSIFKSCPALTKLVVFACFKVKDVKIPKGLAVVGMPNAQDNIITEGDFIGDL